MDCKLFPTLMENVWFLPSENPVFPRHFPTPGTPAAAPQGPQGPTPTAPALPALSRAVRRGHLVQMVGSMVDICICIYTYVYTNIKILFSNDYDCYYLTLL